MSLYLSPVVGVGNVDEREVLGQQVVPVYEVHQEAGVQQSVLGHDELLEVVDGDGAGALEEPPVGVLLLWLRGHPVPVNVVRGFAKQNKTKNILVTMQAVAVGSGGGGVRGWD